MTCLQPESSNSVQNISDSSLPAVEGTVVFLTCPSGQVLTGPNMTVCMGNRGWEPNPKEAQCKGDCKKTLIEINMRNSYHAADCKSPMASSNVSLNHSSTLEDSMLTFQCKDGLLPDDVFTARCYRNRSWIPNPLNHICATSLASKSDQFVVP